MLLQTAVYETQMAAFLTVSVTVYFEYHMTSNLLHFVSKVSQNCFYDPERFPNVGLTLDPVGWFTGLQTHNKPCPALNYIIIDDSALKIIFRLRPGLKLVLSIIQADLQCVNNNTFAHQGFSAEQLKVECRTNDCLKKKHKHEHNSKTTI